MGCCCTGIAALCCAAGNCADNFCGGCLTGCLYSGEAPGCSLYGPCAPCNNPVAGQDVALCNLPLTNPSNDPLLEPLASPCSHGATDPPPHACANQPMPPSGGGGGGSAKSSNGGAPQNRPSCKQASALTALLSKFGTALTSLSGKLKAYNTNKTAKENQLISSPAFLLVLIVVGGLLIFMAWGKGENQ